MSDTAIRIDPDAQAAILERGLNYLNHAYQIEPANYQVLYSLGEAHYIYALMFDSRRRDDQTYSSQQQRQYGQLELKHLKAALEINQRTRRGLDYHLIYYQRALINLLMHRIAPSPEVASQVIENLQKTLAYCPNFSTALAQWIDFVQSRTGTDPRQIDVLNDACWRWTRPCSVPAMYDRPTCSSNSGDTRVRPWPGRNCWRWTPTIPSGSCPRSWPTWHRQWCACPRACRPVLSRVPG